MVWNAILTYFISDRSARPKDSGDVTENVVIDYSNDISEMAEDARGSIVTVSTYSGGLRHIVSGIIFARDDKASYVFTTEQNPDEDQEITVTFDSSAQVSAKLVATDSECGVSLLKIEPSFEVTPMRTGSTSLLRPGEYAAAIGGRSAMSGSAPISFGIISRPAQRRLSAGSTWFANTVDIDANVVSDMLGGPVLNIGGQLIGMLVSRSSGGDRMATALSVNEMKILYDEFMEEGLCSRGSLGLTCRSVGTMRSYEKSQRDIKLNVTSGVLVTYIADNSPVEGILETGDIITKMDGTDIIDEDTLRQLQYSHLPFDEVALEIIRGTETQEVSVLLQ